MSPAILNIRFAVRLMVAAVLFFAVALMAGCGGGGGSGAAPVSPPVNPKPVNCGATLCADLAAQHRTSEFNNQYGLGNINAHYAYAYGQHRAGRPFSGRGVTVAVVDSGVDRNHSEFSGRILPGYNAVNPGSSVRDLNGHGTGAAGVIAAAKTDSVSGARVHGVAYEATILPVQTGADSSLNFPAALEGFDYAVTSGAFVVNNSWGPTDKVNIRFNNGLQIRSDWRPLFAEIAVDILRAADTENIDVPTLLASLRSDDIVESLSQELADSADGNIDGAEANRIVRDLIDQLEEDVRFAAALRIESPPAEFPIVVFASGNSGFNTETGRNEWEVVRDPTGRLPAVISITATSNNGGFWGQLPLMAPDYQGHWLNVVAVDRNNRIASFSNGCGASRDWCLAAPGVDIVMPNTGGGRQILNGTSFAAPHVSGAAAVLKSAFPNLTAPQVVALLLTTARDLGRPGVDDVYGHGLVDLEKATRPQGGLRIAYARSDKSDGLALADFGDSDLARSRVAASPALSPKAKHIPVGFLDGYDRAYQADFANFVQPAATLPSGFFFHPRMTTTEARDGFYVRGASGEAPQAVGWKTNTGAAFADVFEVRRNNGMSFAESDNRPGAAFAFALGTDTMRGMRVAVGDFAMGVSEAESSSGVRVRQAAVAMTGGGAGWNVAGEGGAALESDSVLGAKFGGAFALREARTFYGKLSGEAKLFRGDGLSSLSPFHNAKVFAGGIAGWTDATPGAGAVVGVSELRSHGWEAGLSGERWRLSYVRPLRSSSGTMRIRTVGGYDESGSYVVRESVADLSSPRLWRARAEWTDGERSRFRAEVGERRRMNFAAEFLF